MKLKWMAVLLSAVMLTTALAGCTSAAPKETGAVESEPKETAEGETAKPAQAEAEPAAGADPASITGAFTYWSFTDSANNLVKAFNEEYPNVKIDLQIFGGDEYRTKILTALQSGQDVPDVFDLEENYMYEFLDSDLIADLSYIGIEEMTKNYYEFQVAQMKDSAGKFKALVFQSSPVAFWYLRDACEEWLGTSNPAEISAMLSDWDAIIKKGEEVYEKSGGTVSLWPNIMEVVKVEAFSYEPLVRDGKLTISEDWITLIDSMRTMYASKANAELGSWSAEWASAWNEGKLLFRAMPSWDFFTDWDANNGNVGVATPFQASFEGATGTCVFHQSENKEAAGAFLSYIGSDDFQKLNMEQYNQVPANQLITDEMAQGFSAPDYGGQNLLATYSEICGKIAGITPDKYTRSTQNLFQKCAADGIKAGQDNDAIVAEFQKKLKDQYPEVVIE